MSSRTAPTPHDAAYQCLAGPGKIAAEMRLLDWSKTPLGPVEKWPQSLRTSVSVCLNSAFAILVWWGPDLVMLYNDAYSAVVSNKHPRALGAPGKDIFPEVWDTIGPMLEGVLKRGEAVRADDLLLVLERNGYAEECYFTFSYSPILDESGGIGGVFTPVQETTERIIGERRLQTLTELSAVRAGKARTAEEACKALASELGHNANDLPFASIYLFNESTASATLAATSVEHLAEVLCPRRVDSAMQWPPLGPVLEGKTIVTTLSQFANGDLPKAPCNIAVSDCIFLPITQAGGGRPRGFLFAGLNPRKRLDENYNSFLALVADHIASAIADVEAFQQERMRAEALAEMDRAKTLFFSNVSHEFRTPLTLMLGPIEGMLNPAAATSEVKQQDLELIHRNGMRLLKLVNTLLDFARIEAGRAYVVYELSDLAMLTSDAASAFRSAMDQAGLEFVIDCPALSEPIYIDRDMWEKIVLNLISNAFKATLSGRVSVRLKATETHVQLLVEDTGVGIPKDELPKMFDRFHRVQGTIARSHEGTGIGLAFVQELVKLHGGSISVESVEGQGTTFVVSIPKGHAHLPSEQLEVNSRLNTTGSVASSYVNEALQWLPPEKRSTHEQPIFAADSVQAPHLAGANGRILLADDNADMRAYVRRLLAPQFTVREAANGIEALQCLRDDPPDLILTDVMMPELDGFGLLREVRLNESTRTIPVVLLSARAGEEARIEGLQAGADDYVVKPFTARELLARVGTHVTMSRLRKEIAERERFLRAEAQDAQERTAVVLESISDAFLALDKGWRFSYVNAMAETTLSMTRESLIGRIFWEVFPQTVGTRLERYLRRAAEERAPFHIEYFYEPWQRWFENRIYPSRDGGVSIFYRDITEQKNAERALRESEDRFRTLADNISQFAWTADANGSRTWFNRRWFDYTGMTTEQAMGWGWVAAHHPDHVDRISKSYKSAIENGTPWEETCPLRGHDGEFRWFIVRAVPIKDQAGNVTCWFGTNTDITERVQADQALKRSEKLAAAGRLAATVAHEINNPLAITVNLVYLAKQCAKDAEQLRYLEGAERELLRVGRVANRTLSFYRGASPREQFSITALVQELISVFEPACKSKGIQMCLRADDALVVDGSKDEIAQLIMNLLSNAVDAVREQGVITVRCKGFRALGTGRPTALISFADTGPGIQKVHRPMLFEPFFTTKKDIGTGLGLWIVRDIVHKHGGLIRIRTRTHGKRTGTVISVLLPCDDAAPGAHLA